MPKNNRKVLVTGATGKQRGSVVRHMLRHGWNLRALTRDPGSRPAKAMADHGVEVVRGGLEDPASLEAVVDGVWSLRRPGVRAPEGLSWLGIGDCRKRVDESAGAEVFSRVLGKPLEFQELPIPRDNESYQMFRRFNDTGFNANIAQLRQKYPEVRLRTLEQWLYDEGWHKRARRFASPDD